jgi:high-affinity Fe2+/Pb2+ permease
MKFIELNMTPAQIKRSIQLGWGAAAISAVTTILFTFFFTRVGLLDRPLVVWAISSALVTALLGYGVYRRSRRAAITLLVMFLISRIWFYVQTGSLGSPLLSIIFLYCFVEGVRGTRADHRSVAKGVEPRAV